MENVNSQAVDMCNDDWFIVQWSRTGCKGCTNNTNIHQNDNRM